MEPKGMEAAEHQEQLAIFVSLPLSHCLLQKKKKGFSDNSF